MSLASYDDTAALLRVAQTIIAATHETPPILIAQRVPDGWPSSLVPAPPVITLGGMYVGAALTAVFRYPPAIDQPLAAYSALLQAHGWRRAQLGFESTRFAIFCSEGANATLYRAPSDAANGAILVSLTPGGGWPCEDDAGMKKFETVIVPHLHAPAGVREDSGGGGSGGGDHIHNHIRLTTDWSPSELLPWYARQLGEAGWRLARVQRNRLDAVQWLEATDRRGHLWRGQLTVYANSAQPALDEAADVGAATGETLGSSREVFIYMSKVVG